mmetsp:Transcript_24414/g.57279  ORF Transcript_24414/g.57279 Transcript_24414/m.57279 type:complete len:249 (-) Transcript_24414:59-805(-)|eukprot:CAMPEP_0185812188 /NCGR_PEP_ID=MMETSP1322-20130828/8975_1 /TAXON_ID=265543 /ORGANISM="Minutocellus polymorphus, Strain RCC2270" /LENGTH=248 /DNA_ID=CAMNT_0028508699 /DNA_START=56 /DNA_END=802 /DNA_ORIENTATION=+
MMYSAPTLLLALAAFVGGVAGFGTSDAVSRREAFASVLAGSVAIPAILVAAPDEAGAFANKISDKYADKPKRRGPKPKDLGVAKRVDMGGDEYMGLKNCGPAPNCFCSTDNPDDEPEHVIPAWSWPKGYDQEKAFAELEQVISAYKPGQGNIDGGGFEIQKVDAKSGYIYAQFEALKNGYIDDLELAVVPGKEGVQVRSSSRVGYLDFGVNAKRLNYLAKALREKGWNAEGVDLKTTHVDYATQNGLA